MFVIFDMFDRPGNNSCLSGILTKLSTIFCKVQCVNESFSQNNCNILRKNGCFLHILYVFTKNIEKRGPRQSRF